MKLLTAIDVAKRLGVKRETVNEMRRKGLIPYIPGVPALFDEKDVEALLAKRAADKETKRLARQRPEPTEEDRRREWALRLRIKWAFRAHKDALERASRPSKPED